MKFSLFCLGAALVVALPAAASDEAAGAGPVDLTLRSAVWSSNRVLDDRQGSAVLGLNIKSTLRPATEVSVVFDGRLLGQSRAGHEPVGRVRDAFVRHELGPLELRAGWQTFSWGRADTLNPTDKLTPRDYTLLVPTDDEQRFGTPALSAAWYADQNSSVSLHVLRFRPSVLPTALTDEGLPASGLRNEKSEWGFKFDHSGGAVDWSVSAFDGYEKPRQLVLSQTAGGFLRPAIEHPHVQMLGADLATDLQGFGVRAEIAHTRVRDGVSPSLGGKSGDLFAVMGVDRNLEGDHNVNVQYFFRKLTDFVEPGALSPALAPTLATFAIANNQLKARRSGISLRYASQRFDSKFSWELQGIAYLDKRDYALRPRLEYRLADRLKIFAGLDVLRGSQTSYYNSLRRNSAGFIELRWVL